MPLADRYAEALMCKPDGVMKKAICKSVTVLIV